jgi:acyl carrier protein
VTQCAASIEADVRDLLLRILAIEGTSPANLNRREVESWDSLKHMEIVFALEDRYEVCFDESEFAELDSPVAIVAALQRHHAA